VTSTKFKKKKKKKRTEWIEKNTFKPSNRDRVRNTADKGTRT